MFKSIVYRAFFYLLLLIAAVTGASVYFLSKQAVFGSLCAIIALIALCLLMSSYRRFDKRLNFMLLSLQNNDHSFRFPENLNSKTERIFNTTLNKIRALLQIARLATIEQERYYELILNDIRTGILAIDKRGHVYQHNRTALRLLGLSVFTHVNQLRKIDPSFPAIFASLKAGDHRRVSYTNERGTVYLVINVTEISFRNRTLNILTVNDIESELSEKEIESWVRLVRVLTHEIMNSVAPITSLSETLMHYFQEQKTENDFSKTMTAGLETINETGKGLISFVESYRKFTGIRQPEKRYFAIKNCLERVVQLMQLEHDFGQANIQISAEPDDLQVFADERQITQVLVNLVKNALQAIDDKPDGKVTVHAGRNESEQIFIEVRDNGKGIPPELADDIFVPFFTTKDKGSGVGLSVSRYIMRLHNGNLQLQTSSHQGSVFVMTF